MSLWTHTSRGRYCRADTLTALPWTLSLNLRAGESSSETHSLLVRDGLFPLLHLSPPIVPRLFVSRCHQTGAALLFPPFAGVLGWASYFSCVNVFFVLSDTCERARLWAFVSSAVFPPLSHLSISVSQALHSAVASEEVLLWWFLLSVSCFIFFSHLFLHHKNKHFNFTRLCSSCIFSGANLEIGRMQAWTT